MSDSNSPVRILVVDDNRTAADAMGALIRREGHDVQVCTDGASGIDRLRHERFDLVLTDLRMEPVDGMEVVRVATSLTPPVDVVVLTAFGSVEAAVAALKLGARDFITKPATAEQILRRVRELGARTRPEEAIVGRSATATALRAQAESIARVRSTAMIIGETGAGRMHFAHWIHDHGPDANRPLVVARANQLPTPAQVAAAGTLVLHHVDDWAIAGQSAMVELLHAVEVGAPPRIVATVSPTVETRVARGEFLAELYFRLAVLVVRIPPLRERTEDLPELLRTFLEQHGRTFGRPPPQPTESQLAQLRTHAWPGNLREISNLAERAVVMGPSVLNVSAQPARHASSLPDPADGFVLSDHLEMIERALLVRALEKANGDRTIVGRILGLERNTLRYKLNKYGLLDNSS